MWERIPAIFRNKYFIISAAFIIWIGFLDRNNLVYTFKNKRALGKLTEEKDYYTNEIESTKKSLHDLRYNNRTFEKFAREHYLLKREKEEIFLIDEKEIKKPPEEKPEPKIEKEKPVSDTINRNAKKNLK
jgi:cell division protein DivIC